VAEFNNSLNEGAKWYLVRCVSSQEASVIDKIKYKIEKESEKNQVVKSWFVDFFFPELKIKQMDNPEKQKKITKRIRSSLPGYILICMEINDISYNMVRTVDGILSFMDEPKGGKPIPMSQKDFEKMLKIESKRNEVNELAVGIMPNDYVEVIDGSFSGMKGYIKSVEKSISMAKVTIVVFNKTVDIDVKLSEIKKIVE
jgi:transcriptional antiterminator NusG